MLLACVTVHGTGQTPAPPPEAVALRLHGLVEPVTSYAITVPRLAAAQAGPMSQLIVVRLVISGTMVKRGDVLVEFDRQSQVRNARDREAEYRGFLEQIRKKRAENRMAGAKRETERLLARNALRVAELDVVGIELVPKIEAEKKQQVLEEARASLNALQKTLALKEKVEVADLRMLEIQRDRALNAWRNAQRNAERMLIRAPIDGLAVLKSIWKNGSMAVVQEGEEVRPGIPILDVVDPTQMRVRTLVNQADVDRLSAGQVATVRLDSYPSRAFGARLHSLSPVATPSGLNPRIRSFLATFTIDGSDPHLLPDLAAAVDIGPVLPAPGQGSKVSP
jgi:HlyD family secretion protein